MNQQELLLRQAQEIQHLQEQMSLTLDPLYADLNFAFTEWLKQKESQFWRRTLIRCILVVTESSVWNMKNMVPKLADISGVQLTARELLTAKEVRIGLDKDGNESERPKFLPLRDNIKATFALFAKVHKATYAINSNQEFDALCVTYELRNRLMHPKIPSDVPVSDDDIRKSQRGIKWLSDEYVTLLGVCESAVAQWMQGKG